MRFGVVEIGERLTELLAIQEGILAREEIGGSDEILSRGDDGLAVSRRDEVELDRHELGGFGPCFFGLRDVCTASRLLTQARHGGESARRFISSPSKSALYGVQTHSLSRKVRHGLTFTRWAMMESCAGVRRSRHPEAEADERTLCRLGCRLKSTTLRIARPTPDTA